MLEREKHVVLTYTTWEWMWAFLPLGLLAMVGSAFLSIYQGGILGMPFLFGWLGIGTPICFCMQWFVAVTKWQFANPRARLIPGYTRPHLTVLFAILTVLLIANPILQSTCQGTSPVGPLAFALLLGGLFLVAMHVNHGALTIPAMIVFFSGMFPQTSHFWYSSDSDFLAVHIALILAGAALTAWWLWRLAHLHEENEGYFVQAMGYPGSMSRLEGDIHKRQEARKAARRGLWQLLADRWHDRLDTQATKPSMLADYGWGKIQPEYQAALTGIGFALYGLFFDRLLPLLDGHSGQGIHTTLYFCAMVVPAFTTTTSLRGRRPRLAQELLRPASRTAYFHGLFRSMAKQSLLLWLALTIGLWIFVMSNAPLEGGHLVRQTVSFAIWSLALQFPLLAIGMLIARLRSPVGLIIVACILITIGSFLVAFMKDSRRFGSLELATFEYLGTIPTATAAALGFAILGLPLYAWARRSWLNAELG